MPIIKISAVEEKAKRQISKKLKPEIDSALEKIILEINKKTYIYAGLSAYGLFLAFAPLPQILFYILCGLMLAALLYLLWSFIKTARMALKWMGSFERLLKREVQKQTQKHIEEISWIEAKIFSFSGPSKKDIEDFCVSETVRELARRFKRKKWHLLARIAAFAAVIVFPDFDIF